MTSLHKRQLIMTVRRNLGPEAAIHPLLPKVQEIFRLFIILLLFLPALV